MIKDQSSFDDVVQAHIQNKWTEDHHWLYHYDVSLLKSDGNGHGDADYIIYVIDSGSLDKGLSVRR
jgi:hypothetical protein